MNITFFLREECGLLSELLSAAEKEKTALVYNKIEDISNAVQAVEEIKARIGRIEDERLGEYGDISLNDILAKIDGTEKIEAKAIGNQMKKLVRQIEDVNNTNRLLAKQSLNYVRAVMSALIPKPVSTYGQSGKVEGSTTRSSLVDVNI
jgi:FlgN protein.